MKYNIGQMLQLTKDIELKGEISESSKIKKKGTKLFVSAERDLPSMIYLDGDIQLLDKNTEIEGFSVNGIAEWLYICLRNKFELDDFLDDYEIDKEDFKEAIADSLEELGMYDNTGNRS